MKELIIGDRVICPPNKYGIEELDFMGERPDILTRRTGRIEYIHPKKRFYTVRVNSISGKPTYLESFSREEIRKC